MPTKKRTTKRKAKKAPRVTFGPNPYAFRRRRMATHPPYVVTRYVEQQFQVPPSQMQELKNAIQERREVIDEAHKTVKGYRQIIGEGLQMGGQVVSTVQGVSWATNKVRRWWDPAGAARKDGEREGQEVMNEEYGKWKGRWDATKDIASDIKNTVKEDGKAAYNWMFPPKNETIQENPAKNQTETGGGAAPTPVPTEKPKPKKAKRNDDPIIEFIQDEKKATPRQEPYIQANPSPSFHRFFGLESPQVQVPYDPNYLQGKNTSTTNPEIVLENIQNIKFATDLKPSAPPVLGKKRTKWGPRPQEFKGMPTRVLETFYGDLPRGYIWK